MDFLGNYRDIIEQILLERTRIPIAHGEITMEAVFDRTRDHYLLMLVGWDHKKKRVHGSLVHLDIIEGDIWIQRDGTEDGIALELVRAGIPKERIVFGFRSPEMRKHIRFDYV